MANMKKLTRDYGEIIWTGKKCIMGMPISFTRYILTDSKLITRVGLLNLKEERDRALPRLRQVDEAAVRSADSRLRNNHAAFQGLRHPHKGAAIRKAPPRCKEAARLPRYRSSATKYSVRGRDMMGASAHMEDRDGDGIPDPPEFPGRPMV